jgi:uncharacterized membrane protein (DUF4010 family)
VGILHEQFVPLEIAEKLLVSLGIGLLVGFEREWSHKDVGVRTFALVGLLGMLATLASQPLAWIGLGAVVLLVTTMNVGNLILRRDLELTTSVALIVTFILGALVGEGHIFTPTASAIFMTLLLALKPQLTRFAGGVTASEIRSAVLLGLIGFVIYPILPNRLVDPWKLLNPREAWLTVMLIAGIGFVNYVLLRVYSTRGLYYTAIFGGLVNSTAAVAELASTVGNGPAEERITGALALLTVIAMFVRNLIVVSIFSPGAGWVAFWPIVTMSVFALLFLFRNRPSPGSGPPSRLSSPVSLRKIASFGLFFLAIQALGNLAERSFGEFGSVAVSFFGGFVSSASAAAAAGSLAANHHISPQVAAVCTVLASTASALGNLPFIYRVTGGTRAFVRLLTASAITTGAGLCVLALVLLQK